jgi:hypothetical protein
LSSLFAFVLPVLLRRHPALLLSEWGMTTGPPCPPPAMSSPSGDVIAMPFVGADDNGNGTAVPLQGSAFFKDVKGNYYNGLQNKDGKDHIASGSAVLTDGEARALSN